MAHCSPVVVDNGSYQIKAGLANNDRPSVVVPSIVGYHKHPSVVMIMHVKDTYFGDEARRKRGILRLTHPIEYGIITNWDDMEKLWRHTLYEGLRIHTFLIEKRPMLLTESPLNPKANREKTAEIIFEKFEMPALCLANTATLTMQAAGMQTGLAMLSGYDSTHTVPVYHGAVIPEAIQTLNMGGCTVRIWLRDYLCKTRGHSGLYREEDILREIKETLCFVASDAELQPESVEEKQYELPDGYVLRLTDERYTSMNMMFTAPQLFHEISTSNLQLMVMRSVAACDQQISKDLLGNVVLSGGNTLFDGMQQRLSHEVETLIKQKYAVDGFLRSVSGKQIYGDVLNLAYDYYGIESALKKYAGFGERVNVIRPKNTMHTVWTGGAIMASLSDFGNKNSNKKRLTFHSPPSLRNEKRNHREREKLRYSSQII